MDEDDFPEDLAVRVKNVSKTYRLGVIDRRTVRDELVYRWLRLRGRDPKESMGRVDGRELADSGLFNALDNVSFDVRKGETVGLIGRNGAGKSTMLKILARITTPSRGDAWIRGRVGSMLEVGTGFNPELTGRENIYLNGSILGMRKAEIDEKFDEIVDFSEIGEFLDTPVKRYSSGMYVKLAFSIASSLDTDILLLDEVLAVGDAAFRKKSLARMQEIAASGRTILFVSHSMGDVELICSRCIWFDHGRVVEDGPAGQVAEDYLTDAIPFDPSDGEPDPLPVYRFHSEKYGEDHLTIKEDECQAILANSENWTPVGVAYRAFDRPASGTKPLHVFYYKKVNRHFFSLDRSEIVKLRASEKDWTYEGISHHVYPTEKPGTIPVFRFLNVKTRKMFLTADEKKAEAMREAETDWKFERVAYWVLPAETTNPVRENLSTIHVTG